jgi:mannose-6-phosphate isomerase-like protein (cupin superfamily)
MSVPVVYVTGLDAEGRSCVLDRQAAAIGGETFMALRLQEPVLRMPEGRGDAALLDSATPPGGAVYNIYVWRPGERTPMHRTITTDFDVVLQGTIDMVLDTETVRLGTGDCAVLPGVAHAWSAGPEGAIVMFNLVAGEASGSDVDRPRGTLGIE